MGSSPRVDEAAVLLLPLDVSPCVGDVGVVGMKEDLVVVVLSVQMRFKSIGVADFTEGSEVWVFTSGLCGVDWDRSATGWTEESVEVVVPLMSTQPNSRIYYL